MDRLPHNVDHEQLVDAVRGTLRLPVFAGWTKQYGDVEMVLQDAKTLNNARLLVEADLKAQYINFNENPVDNWCFKNSCLKVNDLRQAIVIKTENAKKIDGSVTLVSLYEMFRRYRSDYKKLVGG